MPKIRSRKDAPASSTNAMTISATTRAFRARRLRRVSLAPRLQSFSTRARSQREVRHAGAIHRGSAERRTIPGGRCRASDRPEMCRRLSRGSSRRCTLFYRDDICLRACLLQRSTRFRHLHLLEPVRNEDRHFFAVEFAHTEHARRHEASDACRRRPAWRCGTCPQPLSSTESPAGSLPLSAATAHEVQDKHDQCDNEHDVNQPARHMHDETEQPKNNENHSNC